LVVYRIRYAIPTQHHLEFLSKRLRKTVFDSFDEQLSHEPTKEAANRKRMRPNPLATWELRIGHIRIYYDVLPPPDATVLVVTVGIKERAIPRIGGEEDGL